MKVQQYLDDIGKNSLLITAYAYLDKYNKENEGKDSQGEQLVISEDNLGDSNDQQAQEKFGSSLNAQANSVRLLDE